MGRRTLLLIASMLIAALGTAMVWLYVRGADERAQSGQSTVQVYVAGATLNANTTFEDAVKASPPKQIAVAAIPAGAIAPTTQAGFAGRVLLQRVAAGSVLTADMFATAADSAGTFGLDPRKLALQVSLDDPARVAGLLRPGSNITIFVTIGEKNKTTNPQTKVLLDKVKVLTSGGPVAQAPSGGAATPAVPQALVTLEVDQLQAQKLIWTQSSDQKGSGSTLWFALRGSDDKVQIDRNSATDFDNLFR